MQAQIFNAAGNQAARVLPWGNLQVATEGQAIFSDPFDGATLDTVNRWNTPVLAGAGAVAISGGLATFTLGTVAGAAAAIRTIESFVNVGSSFLQYATIIQFEAGSTLTGLLPVNVNTFFGQGTPNGSYTANTPLADAIGIERGIDGRVRAALYASNSRLAQSVDLTSKFLDGLPHVIGFATRGDTKYFFVDTLEVPAATITYVTPTNINLPIRVHSINHTTGPTVAPTFKITGVQVLDSGSNYPAVWNGVVITRQRSPSIFISLNAVSIAAETTIWTPAAGKRFRLMGYQLSSGTVGGNVVLKDNTAGATIMQLPFPAAAGVPLTSPVIGNGILSGAAGRVLTATGVATQTLSGYIFGCEE
jgi:hypothetical protein